jgi:hypothetical protein
MESWASHVVALAQLSAIVRSLRQIAHETGILAEIEGSLGEALGHGLGEAAFGRSSAAWHHHPRHELFLGQHVGNEETRRHLHVAGGRRAPNGMRIKGVDRIVERHGIDVRQGMDQVVTATLHARHQRRVRFQQRGFQVTPTDRCGIVQTFQFGQLHGARTQTTERSVHQQAGLGKVVQQVVPQRLLSQDFGVPHDDQTVLGTGQSDVQTTRILEEADTLVLVRTHARHNDQVFLATLEGVHAGNFNGLKNVNKILN